MWVAFEDRVKVRGCLSSTSDSAKIKDSKDRWCIGSISGACRDAGVKVPPACATRGSIELSGGVIKVPRGEEASGG